MRDVISLAEEDGASGKNKERGMSQIQNLHLYSYLDLQRLRNLAELLLWIFFQWASVGGSLCFVIPLDC